LDEFGAPLSDPMTSYEIYESITNENKVDVGGVVINATSYPPLVDETPEDYAIRFAGILASEIVKSM